MFKLSDIELNNAFDAIEHHGYSALLPSPPEWLELKAKWDEIRTDIASIDLDTYVPLKTIRVYAPKTRATVRVVTLMHPVYLVIYTSLTLIVAKDIEESRVKRSKKVVFSYRHDSRNPNKLYDSSSSFSDFWSRLNEKSNRAVIKYIAAADIADFYPRIYQHRLENAIESCASDQRTRDVARVLVRKFIGNLSDKNSYGIPVGPYASRILAEAALTDIDSFLQSEGYDFIRWVDDFYFFTTTEQDAQEILIVLAQRLYERHGLTLSAIKTKIQNKAGFRSRFVPDPNAHVDARLQQISELSSRFDPYSEEEIELTDEERAAFASIDMGEIVAEALEDQDLVDYDTISTLLRHPSLLSVLPREARHSLADVLLDNMEHLYPIAESVSGFLSSFTQSTPRERGKIKKKLLKSLNPKRNKWPPDYYIMWILNIFAADDAWGMAPDFSRIFRDHRSEIVRRMSALAIAKNGNRAYALEVRDGFNSSSSLEQLAILLSTRHLGTDERRHWKTSLQLTGLLEKKI